MTGGTFGKFLAVDETMACLTLRHNLIPVLLDRVIGMELRVTFCTSDLMLAAFSLDQIENRSVATTAVSRSQRL